MTHSGTHDVFDVSALHNFDADAQLMLWSETRYYAKGTIIADNREEAQGLIVITAGQVTSPVSSESRSVDSLVSRFTLSVLPQRA